MNEFQENLKINLKKITELGYFIEEVIKQEEN